MTAREELQRARRRKFKRAVWWIVAILSAGTVVKHGVDAIRNGEVLEVPP